MMARILLMVLFLIPSETLDHGEFATPSSLDDSAGSADTVEPRVLRVKPLAVHPPIHTGFPARRRIENGTLLDQIQQNAGDRPPKLLLRVATLLDPPFVAGFNLTDGYEESKMSSPGLVMEMLGAMKKLYNLEYEFHVRRDGVWGEPDENGNWDGVFGMLQRDGVDVIAAASIVRYDRQAVADYTYPFYSSQMGMLIRAPERYIDNRFLIVTAPFHKHVWALVALAIIVSGGIMKALSTALQCTSEVQYSLLQSTWIFFSVFVQQGLPLQPKSWSCRTLLAFWWLAALTLVATFTGNMVALFAVNRSYLPFNNREEMVQKVVHSGYTVITTNASVTRLKFIQSSELPLFRNLWYEMTVNRKWINVTSYDEGVRLVKQKPNMVLLGPQETLRVYMARDCSVTTTNGGMLPVMYAIAFKKGSDITELWSKEIRELTELGFITKWMKDYMHLVATERGRRCSNGAGVTNAGDAIDVIRAQGAFWILLAGAATAGIGLIVEYSVRLAVKTFHIMTSNKRKLTESSRHQLHHKSQDAEENGSDYECPRSYQPTGSNELKLRRTIHDVTNTSDTL